MCWTCFEFEVQKANGIATRNPTQKWEMVKLRQFALALEVKIFETAKPLERDNPN